MYKGYDNLFEVDKVVSRLSGREQA